MKQFLLDEQLAAVVLNYLAARPYGEVFPLIQRLQALPLHEPVKPAPEPKPVDEKSVDEAEKVRHLPKRPPR